MLDITGKTQTHTHSLSLSLSLLLGKSQSLVDSSLTHLSLDSFHLCSFYDMSLAFISSSLCVDVSTWVWLSILSSGSRTKSIQSIETCHEAMKLTHYNQFYQYQNLRIAINIFIRGRMGTCPLLSLFFFKEDEWFNWRFHAYTMVNLPPWSVLCGRCVCNKKYLPLRHTFSIVAGNY